MAGSTEEYISLDKASYDLMEASDYLTEKVQRFTVNGNMEYLNDYFTEAYVTKRREAAIATMAEYPESADALVYLNRAMETSRLLMDREFYAMKLVIEAKGYTDYPERLNEVELSSEDEALEPDKKMRLATDMVLGDEYYAKKNEIRSSMKEGLNELDEMIHDKEKMYLTICMLRSGLTV
ncbi:MAG: hypothetical protein K6E91_14570 [Butyrivibrio sp.]|nr:hypothetical protein [Butyrivibrio sp.]